MKQTILIDLDDTLIYCNKYFFTVIQSFEEIMIRWFANYPVDPQSIRVKQSELDIAAVSQNGFCPTHFPQSLVDTYNYFSLKSGRNSSEHERKLLFELGYSVYEQQFEALPHVEETLTSLLDHGNDLFLYTGGVKEIQQKKIESLQLDRFFRHNVFIAQHKTHDTLESILKEKEFDRTSTWMIGNSIRTDVLPALKAKIHSIHIPAALEWKYNQMEIDIKPSGAFYTLNNLKEVPPTILEFLNANSEK